MKKKKTQLVNIFHKKIIPPNAKQLKLITSTFKEEIVRITHGQTSHGPLNRKKVIFYSEIIAQNTLDIFMKNIDSAKTLMCLIHLNFFFKNV